MYIQEFINKIVTNNKHNKMVFGGQPYFIILKIHGLLSKYLPRISQGIVISWTKSDSVSQRDSLVGDLPGS